MRGFILSCVPFDSPPQLCQLNDRWRLILRGGVSEVQRKSQPLQHHEPGKESASTCRITSMSPASDIVRPSTFGLSSGDIKDSFSRKIGRSQCDAREYHEAQETNSLLNERNHLVKQAILGRTDVQPISPKAQSDVQDLALSPAPGSSSPEILLFTNGFGATVSAGGRASRVNRHLAKQEELMKEETAVFRTTTVVEQRGAREIPTGDESYRSDELDCSHPTKGGCQFTNGGRPIKTDDLPVSLHQQQRELRQKQVVNHDCFIHGITKAAEGSEKKSVESCARKPLEDPRCPQDTSLRIGSQSHPSYPRNTGFFQPLADLKGARDKTGGPSSYENQERSSNVFPEKQHEGAILRAQSLIDRRGQGPEKIRQQQRMIGGLHRQAHVEVPEMGVIRNTNLDDMASYRRNCAVLAGTTKIVLALEASRHRKLSSIFYRWKRTRNQVDLAASCFVR